MTPRAEAACSPLVNRIENHGEMYGANKLMFGSAILACAGMGTSGTASSLEAIRNTTPVAMVDALNGVAFKDTFVYDPKSRGWSLLIESQAPGGGWSNFAVYTMVKAAGKAAH
jgi:hypothetical protein